MKNYKFWLALAVCALPAALAWPGFRLGIVYDIIIWWAIPWLVMLNYWATTKIYSLVGLNLWLMASAAAGSKVSSLLFCKYISDDNISYAMGDLAMVVNGLWVAILLVVSVILRRRKRGRSANGDA